MTATKQMKMPELLVFLRAHMLGFVLAEIFRIGYLASASFGEALAENARVFSTLLVITSVAIVLLYAFQRQAIRHAKRLYESSRLDLLVVFGLGIVVNHLLARELVRFHEALGRVDELWAPTLLLALLVLLVSPIIRRRKFGSRSYEDQLTFLSDEEIEGPDDDALGISRRAEQFAETVLSSGAHSGLVFGIDAPWGTGKTSFLNLAQKHWDRRRSVIVIKFRPLRYASEPDLSERFVRDLCSGIQEKVFAPEFAPAATRYSRMLKGKTDLSFFGMKLTLEPSSETMDELLEDIDDVLRQVGRRLIVIIDDLDRLDPKLINNVLFTVRRTFRLSRATYVLCYDTEMLIANKDEGGRAREFLEKFITVKLSLFVDGRTIERFLRTDWKSEAKRFQTIPADTMHKLSAIMNEVAKMVSGSRARSYAPLLGDLRKVKRFVNAMLLMQLEQTDLGRSDFHVQDLIHLVLLHLHYPGIFRKIYIEETEDRVGSFSVRSGKSPETANLLNAAGLQGVLDGADSPARFLLTELFDVATLGFAAFSQPDEGVTRTRACFNNGSRNLENYLKLIVRFQIPLLTDTFKLYKDAVDEILTRRESIDKVLSREVFSVRHNDRAQDQFWRILINNAHRLDAASANDAINKLVEFLPMYSCSRQGDQSLRQRSIYSLVLLLDRAGFGAPRGDRARDSSDVTQIAERIFGISKIFPVSLIDQLIEPTRGTLGWNDLMLLRLSCNIDRGGQVHNICTALLRIEDPEAIVSGEVARLSVDSMRRFSQEIFARFRREYIDLGRNFLAEVNRVTPVEIYGNTRPHDGSATTPSLTAVYEVRSSIKSFVIYQLTDDSGFNGIGRGCGTYDESGSSDCGGIRSAMLTYLFDVCFDPLEDERNAIEFGDFCIRALRSPLFHSLDGQHPGAYEAAMTDYLPRDRLTAFWADHGEHIKRQLGKADQTDHENNDAATHRSYQLEAFAILDRWVNESRSPLTVGP